MEKLHFASDYMEGAHPQVLDALVKTNNRSTPGYGDDEFCKAAKKEILRTCGCPDGEVYFLVGGTQVNAVLIDAILRPYQGVIAADTAHIAVHEAGAIEYGGHKVLVCEGEEGKLSARAVRRMIRDYVDDANREHMVMPGMVYLSQPTEYGTLYSKEELEDISAVCRDAGIPLYVDGARLAYALAAPENDVTLEDMAALTDAFYIGGTKCGLLFGEALVMTGRSKIPHFFSMIKQHGALLAKGRLLGVQFQALFQDGLYERIGMPAIENAARIKRKLRERGYELAVDSPTNQVFVTVDNALLQRLGERVEYSFMEKVDEDHTMIRLATCWSTTEEKTAELLKLF
ncbi:MAG: beta-eliminating lyase-related protein [Eubacteriales bacterium]|nr:beta-eliminating lyase-related protein [Eubacteriales bacterium]